MRNSIIYQFSLVVIGALLFITIPVSSETVLLRNGGKIQGKVISQNQQSLTIKTASRNRIIRKATVLKVLYQEISEEQEAKIRQEEEKKLADAREDRNTREANQLKLEEEEKKKAEELAELKKAEEQKSVASTEENQQQKKKSGFINLNGKNALYSAMAPGLGQWKDDRKINAIAFPSLLVLGFGALYNANQQYVKSQKEYNKLNNPYASAVQFGLAANVLPTELSVPTAISPPTDPVSALLYYKYTSGDLSSTDLTTAFLAAKYTPNSTMLFNQKRAEVAKNYQNMRNIGYGIALIYLVNVLDAYLFNRSPASVSELPRGMYFDFNAYASNGASLYGVSSAVIQREYTFGYRFTF